MCACKQAANQEHKQLTGMLPNSAHRCNSFVSSIVTSSHYLLISMNAILGHSCMGCRDSPGPSAYNTDNPWARKMLSERHREPAFSMGSGQRSDPTGSCAQASNPGVGASLMYGSGTGGHAVIHVCVVLLDHWCKQSRTTMLQPDVSRGSHQLQWQRQKEYVNVDIEVTVT